MAQFESLAAQNPHKREASVRVALADLDSGSGFLPDLVSQANEAQTYFDFDVVYLPFPSGSVISGEGLAALFGSSPDEDELASASRLYLPSLDDLMLDAPSQLSVDVVCCLTRHLIAVDSEINDLFTHRHRKAGNVRFVSTYGLRRYAKRAKVSFARALLFLCVAELLLQDERWSLKEHKETAGCPLDYCDSRDDIVVSLTHIRFDHEPCRNKVQDVNLLEAVDALLEVELTEKLSSLEH